MTSSNPKQPNEIGPTGLTVAITGPTGEIGISTVDALERDPAVERIVGMARRPRRRRGLHATRTSVVMDIGKTKSVLGWTPQYTSAETLESLASAL